MGDSRPAASELIQQVLADVGGAFVSGLGYIGDRLGLFRGLAQAGPLTSEALASRLALDERYVREWLKAMVSAGYVELDREDGTFSMTPEQQAVLADDTSPVFAAGAFQFAIPSLRVTEELIERFRTGGGIPYSRLGPEVSEAIDRMHRPWFDHQLTAAWLPAVPDLVARLESGIRVLDVGCGRGRSSLALARAYPRSSIVGIDPDGPSIDAAWAFAREAALGNVEFRKLLLSELRPEERFDLVLAIDCIHDMAHPVDELTRIRTILSPGGALFWSEPSGSADPVENRNVPGRMRSALSPYHCMTVSLAQGGAGLGTIIGEAGARRLAGEAGYSRFETLPVPSALQQFFLAS